MKTIGLFVGAGPAGSGTFHYSQMVLEGLAALPRDRARCILYYTHPFWKSYVAGMPIESVAVGAGGIGELIKYSWRTMGGSLTGWLKFARFVHPIPRALSRQPVDLWVFPAQDEWTYQVSAPALSAIHDLMHRYEPRFPEVSSLGRFRWREEHYARICRVARGILVDSETGRQHVNDSYPVIPDRVFTLPLVPPPYVYRENVSAGLDRRYNLPPKFIFYPAQLWEHKNHVRLVQAVHRVLQDGSATDIHLVLVGSKKNNYRRTWRCVAQLGLSSRVHFLGYVPDSDLPGLYRRACALVMPTFFGPTNIPPLEAMYFGCPVAASHVYGVPEQLGNAALFFDPNSVDEIARCVRRLWVDDELRRELVARGHAHLAQWTPRHFNSRLREIIDQILNDETAS